LAGGREHRVHEIEVRDTTLDRVRAAGTQIETSNTPPQSALIWRNCRRECCMFGLLEHR
jgi:hypothetical protein